jgi:alkylation response protein AidB-like acyl-CoA dehydrogenase
VTRDPHVHDLDAQDIDDFRPTLQKWLAEDVLPNVLAFEHADRYPTEMVEQMREFGLFGATIPQRYGGLGLSATAYAEIVAAISAVWMSLTGVLNSHLMMAHLIARFGTDSQRERFLPDMAAGTLRGGLALTEPDCGSDLQAIRTVARRHGDVYVVDGTKIWITNASRGNCLALLVKTDPHAEPRHAGMSLLLVRKDRDGYVTGPQLGKLGYKGVDTVEVRFDRVTVPADRLLGGVEGKGFVQTQGGLELGRINVAARGVGIADVAL